VFPLKFAGKTSILNLILMAQLFTAAPSGLLSEPASKRAMSSALGFGRRECEA
jgi:hypothetical protein